VLEGDTGTTTLVFQLTLSNPSYQAVTVSYATANGTALAGLDYTATSGTATFAPGATTATVSVSVNGETLLEADETFTLNLSGGAGASLGAPSATGTILNDDYAPVANAGPDVLTDEGTTVTFNGGGSTDADGDALSYAWDFGDGSTGSGVSPSHAYADQGNYT